MLEAEQVPKIGDELNLDTVEHLRTFSCLLIPTGFTMCHNTFKTRIHYIKSQILPHREQPPIFIIKANQLVLCATIIVHSQIRTKHINILSEPKSCKRNGF